MRRKLLMLGGWLVGPERLVAIVLAVFLVFSGLTARLPVAIVAAIGLTVFAIGLATIHYVLLLWDRVRAGPCIQLYDPEVDAGSLPSGEMYGIVKVPFANVKPRFGRGAKATGFFAEFRVANAGGSEGMEWTRAIGPIVLDPNGLKHDMDTVIQVQNVPPKGGYLEPWKPSGRTGVGFKAPVVVEIRWECNEAPRGEQKMRVDAGEPPSFLPKAEWIG